MSQQVARTPGAKRAGDGEYVFDLAAVNHILGGPDYSTANGACVEGDRMIVALMRMPAGTGAQPHSHPNEQWIYILQGTFRARIGEAEIEAKPGSVVYVPSNVVHSAGRRPRKTSSSSHARMRLTACTASRQRDTNSRGGPFDGASRPVTELKLAKPGSVCESRGDNIARLIACFRPPRLGYNHWQADTRRGGDFSGFTGRM